MDKELFFKQVKEFDKMAAKLTLAAARNNFFVLNSNNSSIGVRWLNEKILFDAIEKDSSGFIVQNVTTTVLSSGSQLQIDFDIDLYIEL